MPTASTGSSTKRSKHRTGAKTSASASKTADAIKLLREDHREVKTWFKQYEKLDKETEKEELARKICAALTVHAKIEEEIFYPALRKSIDDDELLDEAEVEHASAKQLIAEIRSMSPKDHLFDAKVKVLGEYVMHHVQEEEQEMFPEARKSEIDLDALGVKLSKRKAELMKKAA
ncbi:hemerythrin domain-containing protein [Methylocystis sp. FS]|uniref:hemerythrin domain-containing protein n=1 Tax=Methylocystis silviterrae TaxID=2743612 RepID=UPI001582F1D0|nr:hemerythrin domain-containing protein [Methylocystis silviterrae]NUJ78884.1 hemerythrin domain-containing protein [Methylocystis silviterrae]